MGIKEFAKHHGLSLWLWWPVITSTYLASQFSLAFLPPLNYLAYFIGMFVPVGFFSFGMLLEAGAVYFLLIGAVIALFILSGNKIGNRLAKDGNVTKQVIFNLIWLALLTFVVDMILWGSWNSLEFLLIGGLL